MPLALSALKEMDIHQLTAAALEAGIDSAAGSKKHDLIFRMLHAQAQRNGLLFAEGVLEIMPDGYGFLRAPESSYLAGPDDIYVSPSQIRRFDLRTATPCSGQVRPPREGERYFALIKVEAVNFDPPELADRQGAVRQPDAALPARAAAARDHARQHDRARARHDDAARQGPARR